MADTPRDALLRGMTPRQKKEYTTFEARVVAECLKHRDAKDATSPYVIDARNELLGHGKRETIKNPSDPEWPTKGDSTADEATARKWAETHYVPRLWQGLALVARQPIGRQSVAACAQRYADSLAVQIVDGNGRTRIEVPDKWKSRISVIRTHVVPRFGKLVFASIAPEDIRPTLENLAIIECDKDGKEVSRRPASEGTKHHVLASLRAIWRYCYPDSPMPFADLKLRSSANAMYESEDDDDDMDIDAYDEEGTQRQVRAEEEKGALTPEEFRLSLVAGMHLDADLVRRPNMRALGFVPIIAHICVLLVALGCRVSELMRVRWKHINLDRGFVIIRQSKRTNGGRRKPKPKYRVVPLQNDVVPWLLELAEICGVSDPRTSTAFVVRLNARVPGRRSSKGSVETRVKKALIYAGTKIDEYSTKWGRATHASMGTFAHGVKDIELRHFLGHVSFSGSTQQYLATIIAMIRPEHRTYIKLPHPAEIRSAVASFQPAAHDWKESRTVQPRDKAAKEARRTAREQRKTLGTRVSALVRDA